MPKVSVLVAAFNAAASIEATLASVAVQSFGDWECVVVDDGSTDSTSELVGDFASRDQRFRLIRLPHTGVVEARNHCLQSCRGEYVAILDADDRMMPDRLRLQTTALDESPQLAAVGCHVQYQPRERVTAGRLAYEEWLNGQRSSDGVFRDRYIEMPVGHPTLMLRRDSLVENPYRDKGWPEDWDLLLRIVEGGARTWLGARNAGCMNGVCPKLPSRVLLLTTRMTPSVVAGHHSSRVAFSAAATIMN